MRTPKVSIGMPVYNGELFIREALDSLLAQTFTDFELVISDNASTDGTEAICREYNRKDDRIRYVRQTENRGAVANFRYVLDEAVGEYFMWAAADDMWSPNWLEVLMRHAKTNVVCCGAWQRIGLNGEYIGERNYQGIVFPKSRLMKAIGLILPYPKPYNHLIYGLYHTESMKSCDPCTVIMKLTSSIAQNGNEINFLFVFLQKNSIVIDDAAIIFYRTGGLSSPGTISNSAKIRSLLVNPIHAFSGTIKLLSLLPHNDNFRFWLYVFYPLAASARMVGSYIHTSLNLIKKLTGN